MGTVYLLCFEEPNADPDMPNLPARYKHAGHYLGWSSSLDARLEHHRHGTGANLMRYVVAAGLTFTVTRTWEGDRALERRLKRQGSHARLCPRCPVRRSRHRQLALVLSTASTV